MSVRRLLSSPKVAAILIAGLLALALASVIVPQSQTLGSAYIEGWRSRQPWLAGPLITVGLDRVFSSWPYWLISTLLTVNLVACTIERMLRRRTSVLSLGPAPETASETHVTRSLDEIAADLRTTLRGSRVSIVDGGIVCVSGAQGFLGSVAMHLGLLLLIAAGVLTGLTRFEGTLVLAEGQTVADERDAYLALEREPQIGDPYTGAALRLESLDFEYAGPTVTDAKARLSVDEGSGARVETVRVNEPLRVGAKAFLLDKSGYAVGLRVLRPDGDVALDAVVNLGESVPAGSQDALDVDGLSLRLTAVPDAAAPRGAAIAEKLTPVDPGVWVEAVRTTGEGTSTVVLRDVLRPGGSGEVYGWRVEIRDVRRWTTLNARLDGGLEVAYAGFLLVVAGTALRVLDPDRVVRVRVAERDGRVHALVWVRARWGRQLAAATEQRVAARLTGEIHIDGDGGADEEPGS